MSILRRRVCQSLLSRLSDLSCTSCTRCPGGNLPHEKIPSPRKFFLRYPIVLLRVSCGSRGEKPNSSTAFDESKYQKYSACSTSFGSIGDVLPQFLKTELITFEPVMASCFGSFSLGPATPDNRSSRAKKSENVMFEAPSKYFSWCRPFSSAEINALAASLA